MEAEAGQREGGAEWQGVGGRLLESGDSSRMGVGSEGREMSGWIIEKKVKFDFDFDFGFGLWDFGRIELVGG